MADDPMCGAVLDRAEIGHIDHDGDHVCTLGPDHPHIRNHVCHCGYVWPKVDTTTTPRATEPTATQLYNAVKALRAANGHRVLTIPEINSVLVARDEWVAGVAAGPNAEYEALRAAERGFIVAPWTDRQVEALNTWQRERPVHPFTCGKRDDHESEGVLTATREGWVCKEPDCDYAQDWAHDFMAMTAGVAAGPQATPDQVLWEGETTEAERISGWSYVADNEGQQRRDWGRCSLLVQVPGGTRVRVVAVPTDPTTVRVAEVRRPIPGARDMTGDAVPTDHEDRD